MLQNKNILQNQFCRCFFVLHHRFAHWLSPIRNSHLVVGCLNSALLRSGSASGFALLVDSDNWLHFFCVHGAILCRYPGVLQERADRRVLVYATGGASAARRPGASKIAPDSGWTGFTHIVARPLCPTCSTPERANFVNMCRVEYYCFGCINLFFNRFPLEKTLIRCYLNQDDSYY